MQLAAIFWRYLALAVQFLLVILVTRRVAPAEAGAYFAAFGVVTVGAVFAGFGLPDGAVRLLPTGKWNIRSGMVRMMGGSCLLSIPLALAAGPQLAGWSLAYCAVFVIGQGLVAKGDTARGAFVVYSAINLAYLAILVPYIALTTAPPAKDLIAVATLASWVAVVVALALVRLPVSHAPDLPLAAMWRNGWPLVWSRGLQALLPWVPVWALFIFQSPAESAIYAAAARLTVAFAAVIATFRFALRPHLVTARAADIARLARRVTFLSMLPPLAGLGVLAVCGPALMETLFGKGYGGTSAVLAVLLLGTVAEAIGGIADEILKMRGEGRIVILSLVAALFCSTAAACVLAPYGAVWIAASPVIGFAVQYGLQLLWLARRGIPAFARAPE